MEEEDLARIELSTYVQESPFIVLETLIIIATKQKEIFPIVEGTRVVDVPKLEITLDAIRRLH